MSKASPALSVRVTPDERDLLEIAAGQARPTLSDFIRRKAVEAAEIAVVETRVVTIPAADWDTLEAWANAPPKRTPELVKLACSRPVWKD